MLVISVALLPRIFSLDNVNYVCVRIGKAEFQRVAREIGEIQKQCGLKEPVEDFVEQVGTVART